MSMATDRKPVDLSSESSGAMKILVPKDTAIYSHLGESELILHRDTILQFLGKREAKQGEEGEPEYVFRVVTQDRTGGQKRLPTRGAALTKKPGRLVSHFLCDAVRAPVDFHAR
jgi:hypothetical protein